MVAAFDNDEAGDRLTKTLANEIEGCRRNDIEFRDHRPPKRGADWNSKLMYELSQQSRTIHAVAI